MSAVQAAGRFDPACRVHITGEQLKAAGLDPHGGPYVYRVWAGERGRFVVTLREEES